MENKNNNEYWKVLVFTLDEIRKDKGIKHEDVAEKTGYAQSNISRFFSAKYKPGLDIFLSVANAIGVNFFFESKDSKTELNVLFEQAMERLGRRPDKLPKN